MFVDCQRFSRNGAQVQLAGLSAALPRYLTIAIRWQNPAGSRHGRRFNNPGKGLWVLFHRNRRLKQKFWRSSISLSSPGNISSIRLHPVPSWMAISWCLAGHVENCLRLWSSTPPLLTERVALQGLRLSIRNRRGTVSSGYARGMWSGALGTTSILKAHELGWECLQGDCGASELDGHDAHDMGCHSCR